MPSNIFVKVKPLLKEKKFDIDLEALIDFFGKYHSNEWIYPAAIHRELKIDSKIIYEILQICADNGIVEPYLEIYCPKCNRYAKQYYRVITDIPEITNCSQCGAEIVNPVSHAIVIYKVV